MSPIITDYIIICPIAIAYSMRHIIESVCVCVSVCLSVCLSVCEHSHGRISSSIITKIGTDVRTPKSKNEFVGGSISHHPFPYFAPRTAILGQEVLKTHANIK